MPKSKKRTSSRRSSRRPVPTVLKRPGKNSAKERHLKLQRTALIPFWARVADARQKKPILGDRFAESVAAKIEKSFGRLRLSKAARIKYALASRMIDIWLQGLTNRYATSLVVDFGVGFSSRAERLKGDGITWVEIDAPGIIAARNRIWGKRPNVTRLAASALEYDEWGPSLPTLAEGPTIFIMEGLLPYLRPNEAIYLLGIIASRFPGAYMLFDSMAPPIRMLGNSRPREIEGRPDYNWALWSTDELRDRFRMTRLAEKGLMENEPEFLKAYPPLRKMVLKLPGLRRLYRVTMGQM